MGPSPREAAPASSEGDESYGPGFFFSYAHTPPLRGDRSDPDYWVKRFYHDLETEVRRLDHRLRGGFLEDRVPPGPEHANLVARSLTESRTFVPLYSDNYFESEKCGREWALFERRRRLRKARTAEEGQSIIPVRWIPGARVGLPPCAERVYIEQLLDDNLYLEVGMYELIRLHEREYNLAVYRLAELIVRRARTEHPPVISPQGYSEIEPLFPGRVQPHKQLFITIAAPIRRTLPNGRDPEYYGPNPEEWRPYQPLTAEPLAERAARIAQSLGYVARISILSSASPETKMPSPLESMQKRTGPSILLADPWIFDGYPQVRTALERVDRWRREWVRLMVPWNDGDAETRAQRLYLDSRVQSTVPWMFQCWRRSCPPQLLDLSSVEQFDEALPIVIDRGRGHYLSSGEGTTGSSGGYPSRPRLVPPPSADPQPLWAPPPPDADEPEPD